MRVSIETKHLVIILVAATIINAAISYSFFGGRTSNDSEYSLGKAHEETIASWEFYKHLPIVLEATDAKFLEGLEKQFEDENSGFQQSIYAVVLFEASKKTDLMDALQKRLADYKAEKEKLSKLDSSDLFSKNNSCSNLASDIKKELKAKEEFEFIFYSPVLNECAYSISRSVDATKGYRDYKVLLSGTTRKELGNYLVYGSYNYEDFSGNKSDSLEDQIKTDKKKYLDFVLINSLYNFDLLKDVSHIGDSF